MDNLGSLVIVLHSHLPYGLGHDPMEEHWLYEAAVETYLPLLEMAERLGRVGLKPNFAVSFTPVLLEQLADQRFKRGFNDYLGTLARVAEDERQFRGRRGEVGLARLQRMWRDYYANALAYFTDALKEDLLGGFRRAADSGVFELLTSGATHAYLPLVGLDQNVRAQVELGVSIYRRHFGREPRGFWLPECGFRPGGHWWPPGARGPLRDHDRRGIDDFLRDAAIDYCFVDQAQLKMSPPSYSNNSPLRLHRLGPYLPDNRRLLGVYARGFDITRRVWQSEGGYPGDSLYLDFHKKTEQGKFRLWRVTGAHLDMACKEEYDPVRAFEQVRMHAQDFATVVRDALRWHLQVTGEAGVVVASFDAELFGHWWFEGVAWLEELARLAGPGSGFMLDTPARYFDRHRPASHVELRESSWGRNNDHSVWLDQDGMWTWWNIYDAEVTMQHLGRLLNGRELSHELAGLLRQAMRELLLLEGSDWTFMISTWSTRDHAEWRASSHFNDFTRLAALIEQAASGQPLSDEDRDYVRATAGRDTLFADLDLNLFWRDKCSVREVDGDATSDECSSLRGGSGQGRVGV